MLLYVCFLFVSQRRYVDAMAPTIAEAVPSIGSQGMTMPQFTSLLSMELMGRVLFNKRLGALGVCVSFVLG